ncbi:hypothetical protein FGO68_gene7540 [Halteria grandinella]|uniref:Uncharacterized protein n=1 Tax=Halteria grandinella TaxID=5974 RepID=A0A8J8NRH5_HALGN|nr:hypothetical protein FGO68_gene7540 [Halteria grandinella]
MVGAGVAGLQGGHRCYTLFTRRCHKYIQLTLINHFLILFIMTLEMFLDSSALVNISLLAYYLTYASSTAFCSL